MQTDNEHITKQNSTWVLETISTPPFWIGATAKHYYGPVSSFLSALRFDTMVQATAFQTEHGFGDYEPKQYEVGDHGISD